MKTPSVILFLAVLLFSTQASAHAVYVFAWQEGDKLCTDSYFSKKSKVRGGTVHMQNSDGNTLQAGTTGEDGICCFPIPDTVSDLIFVVEAGEGHRGKFTLPAEQIISSDLSETNEAHARALAEKNDQTPTLREIIGGLGWIVGIFSLLFWLRQRKKEKNN